MIRYYRYCQLVDTYISTSHVDTLSIPLPSIRGSSTYFTKSSLENKVAAIMVGVLEQVLSRVQGYLPGSETRVIFRNRASMRRRTGRIDIYGVSPHHLGTTRDS